MGRPIVYKILNDIIENNNIDAAIPEALINDPVTAGMDKYDLYNGLQWLADEFHRYCYGDKKELAEEMRLMS